MITRLNGNMKQMNSSQSICVNGDGHLSEMRDGSIVASFPRHNQPAATAASIVDLSNASLCSVCVSSQALLYALEDTKGFRPPRVFIPIGIYSEPIGLWALIVTLHHHDKDTHPILTDLSVKEAVDNAKCIAIRISQWLSSCEASKHLKLSLQLSLFSR